MERLRAHLLQALFPVAIGWGLAQTFAGQVDRLGAPAAVPEGHPLHDFFETHLPLVVVILACGAVMLPVYRRWPRLLRVPDSATWPRLLFGVLICGVVTLPLLMIASGLIGAALESEPADPTNPQHIPLWIFTATFYPYSWTPAAAILAASWWLRRRGAAIARDPSL